MRQAGGSRMRRLAMALCAFSMMASAQQDPLASFPLEVGSRWIYEHEWKSGDRARPDIDRWTTEETIIGWVKVTEGLVILRDANQRTITRAGSVTHTIIGLNGEVRAEDTQGSSNGARLVAMAKYPYLDPCRLRICHQQRLECSEAGSSGG